jgi:hypothetical protein
VARFVDEKSRLRLVMPSDLRFLVELRGLEPLTPTARVKPGVLARIRASVLCRNVHVGGPTLCLFVYCVFARDAAA